MKETTTKARFTESLDIIANAWTGDRRGPDGEFFRLPSVLADEVAPYVPKSP